MIMNNLSWALYLTDVFGGIGGLSGGLIFVGVVATIMLGMGLHFAYDDAGGLPYERDLRRIKLSKNGLKISISVLIVFTILGIFVPGRETMRMILVSEFGEKVYNSTDAQELINPAKELLKAYIQDQLKEKK